MRDHKRKHHSKDHNDNPVEALFVDLAEDTKQKTDMGKGLNPIQNSDLEIPTSKMTGGENSMTGIETRPGDELKGMHLKVDKMEPNVTTKEQRNIFIQKDI